jgi:hypothetical protein
VLTHFYKKGARSCHRVPGICRSCFALALQHTALGTACFEAEVFKTSDSHAAGRTAFSEFMEDGSLDAVMLSPHKLPGGPGSSGVLVVKRSIVRSHRPQSPGARPPPAHAELLIGKVMCSIIVEQC